VIWQKSAAGLHPMPGFVSFLRLGDSASADKPILRFVSQAKFASFIGALKASNAAVLPHSDSCSPHFVSYFYNKITTPQPPC
jgi:hypothetical protein